MTDATLENNEFFIFLKVSSKKYLAFKKKLNYIIAVVNVMPLKSPQLNLIGLHKQ